MTTFKAGDVVFIKDESLSYMNSHADYGTVFKRKTPYKINDVYVQRHGDKEQEYVHLCGCRVRAYPHRFYKPVSDKPLSEYL